MNSILKGLWVFFLACSTAFATTGKYDFLDKYETPIPWEVEKAPDFTLASPVLDETDTDLSNFYDDFTADGKVSFYLGFGKDAYNSRRATEVFNMLKSLAKKWNLDISNWKLNNEQISFRDARTRVLYTIQIGSERNQYMRAFANTEIVMYHGHSRYGRGPAFQTYSNYYRMGNVFDTIEVDVRNRYYLNEPILKQDEYPLKTATISGKTYDYQYKGQKVKSSYLSKDAYTKIIPGGYKDLRRTTFMQGRQIIWLYSCQNVYYWKTPIRTLFPSKDEKFTFGTKKDGYWGSKPAVVFILSVVKEDSSSENIVKEMNATKDCKECFTSF